MKFQGDCAISERNGEKGYIRHLGIGNMNELCIFGELLYSMFHHTMLLFILAMAMALNASNTSSDKNVLAVSVCCNAFCEVNLDTINI